ncbi:hypothetical protein F4780DRAFT_323165 [Xylariomycetidae sp. FL0641]|nr:hypothetical protein F4780DRAFT_189875 [Xylariomycetidae sp. FL0641]KAI0025335.1 hypothetical protein F4780DRAFT_323165 [Xylariomycetidae sp. FL0641]
MHERVLLERVPDGGLGPGQCPPNGGNFYICQKNGFKGCCKSDPCDADGCRDDDDGAHQTTTTTAPTTTKPGTSQQSTPTTAAATFDEDSSSETITFTPTGTALSSITDQPPTASQTSFTTTVLSTIDSTGGLVATTATLPIPSSTTTPSDNEKPSTLSTAAIAGASIAGTLGAIAILILIFISLRRRRISKRTPSRRGSPDDPYDDKGIMDQSRSPSDAAGNHDIWAPFGGRANSPEGERPKPTSPRKIPRDAHDARTDESKPLRGSMKLARSPYDEAPGPSQLDSQPVYVELDSTETERSSRRSVGPVSPLTAGGEDKSSNSSGSRSSKASSFHPSPLTPGFPGTQMAIQCGLRDSRGSASAGYEKRDSRIAPIGAHRATLNATVAERSSNRHVTSWAEL